jgi:hypothetical protein
LHNPARRDTTTPLRRANRDEEAAVIYAGFSARYLAIQFGMLALIVGVLVAVIRRVRGRR